MGVRQAVPPGKHLADLAWYYCNNTGRTRPVGVKEPNAWGLFDMLGGVWEWTWSAYANALMGGTDPAGPETGAAKVLRGASWGSDAALVRAARRTSMDASFRDMDIGFRLARSAP